MRMSISSVECLKQAVSLDNPHAYGYYLHHLQIISLHTGTIITVIRNQ